MSKIETEFESFYHHVLQHIKELKYFFKTQKAVAIIHIAKDLNLKVIGL